MDERANAAALTNEPARRQAILGVVGALEGLGVGSARAWAAPQDGISHTADSIHQEPVFTASPKRVYEALTDAKRFDGRWCHFDSYHPHSRYQERKRSDGCPAPRHI